MITPTVTPEELERLRALEAQASPAPWDVDHDPREGGSDQIIESRTGRNLTLAFATSNGNELDFELIVMLRNAFPSLVSTIDRLRGERDEANKSVDNLRAGLASQLKQCEQAEAAVDVLAKECAAWRKSHQWAAELIISTRNCVEQRALDAISSQIEQNMIDRCGAINTTDANPTATAALARAAKGSQ